MLKEIANYDEYVKVKLEEMHVIDIELGKEIKTTKVSNVVQ